MAAIAAIVVFIAVIVISPFTVVAETEPEAFAIQSWTYVYSPQYGYPETDTRGHAVGAVRVSEDRRAVSIDVEGLRRGRVYELRLDATRSEGGEPLLHPEAYYTLNRLRECRPRPSCARIAWRNVVARPSCR